MSSLQIVHSIVVSACIKWKWPKHTFRLEHDSIQSFIGHWFVFGNCQTTASNTDDLPNVTLLLLLKMSSELSLDWRKNIENWFTKVLQIHFTFQHIVKFKIVFVLSLNTVTEVQWKQLRGKKNYQSASKKTKLVLDFDNFAFLFTILFKTNGFSL